MLPPNPGSCRPNVFGGLWAWATASATPPPPQARDEPPVIVTASGGIDPAVSEGLSYVIRVQPLSSRPPGTAHTALLDEPIAPVPEHVIDIRPAPAHAAGGWDHKHTQPPDTVIDLRDPHPPLDEEVPAELPAPARMVRDGSQRVIPAVRFQVPPDAVRAVHRTAERQSAAGQAAEVVTSAATLRIAARMGMEQAAAGFLTQLAGRTVGLAVTAALRRSDGAAALGASLGTILASNLLFGHRTAVLITRALGLEEPTRPGNADDYAGAEVARLSRATRVATALAAVPLLTQALLPVLGMYAGTSVGLKIAATIAGRIIAAVVRDGLTQAAVGMMRSVEVVTASGRLADPNLLREEFDPLRIDLAVLLYTMTSGLLLTGTGELIGEAIEPGPATSFAQLVRRGMGPVLASSINEGLDGLMPSLARAAAAITYGLRLVPKGWHAAQVRQQAEQRGHRPRPAESKRHNTSPKSCGDQAKDWARRTQAHAGMRITFGTFTSDIWNGMAEMLTATWPAAAKMCRVAAAIANGQTGRRGYTVELGNQPTQAEIDTRHRQEQAKIEHKLDGLIFMTTRTHPRFPEIRAALHRAFRDRLLATGVIPDDAPDRKDRLQQLDEAIGKGAGKWLDSEADDALKRYALNQILSEYQGPYHFVVDSAANEGAMVEAESLQISSLQSEVPTRDGSGNQSRQLSPRPPVRRPQANGLQPVAGGMSRAEVPAQAQDGQPVSVQDLHPGQAAHFDGERATFLGMQAPCAGGPQGEVMVLRTTRDVQRIGWARVPGETGFVYYLDPRFTRITDPEDAGYGLGPPHAGAGRR